MITWDIDHRRAYPYTRLYMRGMWLKRDKSAFKGSDQTLRLARKRQRTGDAPPTRLAWLLTRVARTELAGMTVWTACSRRGISVVRVVYLHGGGYVHPLSADYWRLVRALVRVPAQVVVPAYPLAPDATVDEVRPRLLEIVREAGQPDLPTVLMGDSAGGAMALALARRLCDGEGPAPRGVIGLSPWLDAKLEDDGVQELEASYPMLAESGLRAAGR